MRFFFSITESGRYAWDNIVTSLVTEKIRILFIQRKEKRKFCLPRLWSWIKKIQPRPGSLGGINSGHCKGRIVSFAVPNNCNVYIIMRLHNFEYNYWCKTMQCLIVNVLLTFFLTIIFLLTCMVIKFKLISKYLLLINIFTS